MKKINFTRDIEGLLISAWTVLKDAFKLLIKLLKKVFNLLKEIKLKTVKKVTGVILVAISYFVLVSEAIIGVLMLVDPIQFNKIILGLLNVSVLAYISPFEYYSMLAGGLLMDAVFWIAIAAVGWHLLGSRFKNLKNKVLIMGTLFILGAFSFSIGLYYALPEVKIPFDQISERIDSHKDRHPRHFNEDYIPRFYHDQYLPSDIYFDDLDRY